MTFSKAAILIGIFLLSMSSFAQYKITIEAILLDKVTKQAIPYANIGFIEKSIGTVSNEQGEFVLVYDETGISENEILQISTLGYESLKLKVSQLFDLLKTDNKIYLTPQPYLLNEVVLINKKREQKTVGISRYNEETIAYWKDKDALGGEVATKIDIKKKHTKLLELKLFVEENLSDSLKIRVNIYDYVKGFPGRNITKTNIFHTITKQEGLKSIDLRPYNIEVDGDFVVGVELIEVYGNRIGLALAANKYLGPSYTRYISQDKWKRNTQAGINFSMLVSVPTNKDKDISMVRKIPDRITLYWDMSLSMQNRLIEMELELLTDYLKKVKTTSVEIIKFNTTTADSKVFEVKESESEALIQYLKDTNYDGGTNYKEILKVNAFDAETILVFTDGNSQFELLKQLVFVPAFYINTSPRANDINLQQKANYGEGYYIDLLKINKKEALNAMFNDIDDETENATLNIGNSSTIFGKVTRGSLIIQGANINIKNSYVQATSDINGNYSIQASEGDILQIEALGMFPKEMLVDKRHNLDIDLNPDGELLEEVRVKGKARKEEKIIDTPYGKKNFDAIGYAIYEMPMEDIKPSDYTYDDIVGKIPGVLILGAGENRRYFFTRDMSTKGGVPIIVVNDMVYTQSNGVDRLPPINMQNIESVQALKSVISTNRYGGAGAYGAIVIRTRGMSFDLAKPVINKPSALAQGNDYIEEDIKSFEADKIPSKYIEQLNVATTFEDAKSIYYNQKKQMEVMPISYVLEASEYFLKWEKDFASNVLTNISEFAYDNPKALLTLSYKLEEMKKFEEAKFIYQRIAELKPKASQSYRDLANIYQETGDYDKAIQLYKQMLSNSIEGVDFTGLQQPIIDELKHLLAFHRSEVEFTDLPSNLLTANFKQDLRLVFEWNDPNAEFEIQFVNPQKKFYKWSHTKLDNRERMRDEIKNGYTTEAYIIDDAEAGEWIINIEALNEQPSKNPNYLKYTIYKNYGLKNETKTVKVIQLENIQQKVTLDKFMYR